MSYENIINRYSNIAVLKQNKVYDFKTHVENLRQVMSMIGKNSMVLSTSEPMGVGHSMGMDKKYSILISKDRISFLNNDNRTELIDDKYLETCKWFQLYIYTVEIELELIKIENHIQDSIAISESIKRGYL